MKHLTALLVFALTVTACANDADAPVVDEDPDLKTDGGGSVVVEATIEGTVVEHTEHCVVFIRRTSTGRLYGLEDEFCFYAEALQDKEGQEVHFLRGDMELITEASTIHELKAINPDAFYLHMNGPIRIKAAEVPADGILGPIDEVMIGEPLPDFDEVCVLYVRVDGPMGSQIIGLSEDIAVCSVEAIEPLQFKNPRPLVSIEASAMEILDDAVDVAVLQAVRPEATYYKLTGTVTVTGAE